MTTGLTAAWKLTEIILSYFGLDNGVFREVKALFKTGKEIADTESMDCKQMFIHNLAKGFKKFLQNENVDESIGNMLEHTFLKHFDMQEFCGCVEKPEELCEKLADKSFGEMDKNSNEYSAYKTVLTGILNVLYDNM